jgi:hypothetical protein
MLTADALFTWTAFAHFEALEDGNTPIQNLSITDAAAASAGRVKPGPHSPIVYEPD